MTTPYLRVLEAANCRTQQELADLLGIRQSSVSLAYRKGHVPAEWLVRLMLMKGVNPEWVLTGEGPSHISGFTGATMKEAGAVTEKTGTLKQFASRELTEELLRRVGEG